MATRNYTYYDFTLSLCSACLERVNAKIVFQDDNVFMLKNCLRGDSPPAETAIFTPVQILLLVAVVYFGRQFYNNEIGAKVTT